MRVKHFSVNVLYDFRFDSNINYGNIKFHGLIKSKFNVKKSVDSCSCHCSYLITIFTIPDQLYKIYSSSFNTKVFKQF